MGTVTGGEQCSHSFNLSMQPVKYARIREITGQRRPVFWHILCSVD